jgi:hypothetical protein
MAMNSPFTTVANSGVSAMHAALIPPYGKVMFLDKVEDYTQIQLPNGQFAYSVMYDPDTHNLQPMSVATNPFCTAGAFLADGRLINLGGGAPSVDPTVGDGYNAIRYLEGLGGGAYNWREPGNKMASNRWYASAQTLADGRVFVAGGSLNGLSQFDFKNNNPTYEILSADGVSEGKNIDMNILIENMPY